MGEDIFADCIEVCALPVLGQIDSEVVLLDMFLGSLRVVYDIDLGYACIV